MFLLILQNYFNNIYITRVIPLPLYLLNYANEPSNPPTYLNLTTGQAESEKHVDQRVRNPTQKVSRLLFNIQNILAITGLSGRGRGRMDSHFFWGGGKRQRERTETEFRKNRTVMRIKIKTGQFRQDSQIQLVNMQLNFLGKAWRPVRLLTSEVGYLTEGRAIRRGTSLRN